MALNLILHGTHSGVSGIAKVHYMLNGNLIASVNVKAIENVSIPSGGILTAKDPLGFRYKGEINLKDNTTTEVGIVQSWKANTITVIKEMPFDQDSNHAETEEPIYKLDGGAKDVLYVYEDRVVISHRGALNALAMGIKGDKTIYYTDITSVQFKKPAWTAGYIQFSLPGGNENQGGVFSAMSDENTISLLAGDERIIQQANEVVEFINQKIREVKAGTKTAPTVIQQISAADELKKFKELLDMGIITQEEFDAKKKQLLGL